MELVYVMATLCDRLLYYSQPNFTQTQKGKTEFSFSRVGTTAWCVLGGELRKHRIHASPAQLSILTNQQRDLSWSETLSEFFVNGAGSGWSLFPRVLTSLQQCRPYCREDTCDIARYQKHLVPTGVVTPTPATGHILIETTMSCCLRLVTGSRDLLATSLNQDIHSTFSRPAAFVLYKYI